MSVIATPTPIEDDLTLEGASGALDSLFEEVVEIEPMASIMTRRC